jgi:CheY-specific phosphatase CheX
MMKIMESTGRAAMPDAWKSEVMRVFKDVLGKQAFLFPGPEGEGAEPDRGDGYVLSSLTFEGAVRGGVMLAVPEPTAREIAANVLGVEPVDPLAYAHHRDSLGELLNVACGHMLTALFGETEVFDLSPPRPFSLTCAEAAKLARRHGCMAFSVDGRQALLHLDILDGIPGE